MKLSRTGELTPPGPAERARPRARIRHRTDGFIAQTL